VVIQGLNVLITGELYANGGGGGAGGLPGYEGAEGTRSVVGAPGGAGQIGTDGNGGIGGTALAPGNGKAPSQTGRYPGAGGGSAGFLLVYTPEGVAPQLTPQGVSPPFETAGTLATN
jgi:hypothetical protein